MTQGKVRMINDPHRKALLIAQRNDGKEHLIALKDGKVIARATSGLVSQVDTPDHILKLICDPIETIKIMHNHPSGGSFSDKDVIYFRNKPGLAEFTAEGTKASFSIRRTAKTGEIDMDEFTRLQERFMKILRPLVLHSKPAQRIHENLAKNAISHAVMQSLDKQGFLEYTTDGNLQKEERIIDDYLRSPS